MASDGLDRITSKSSVSSAILSSVVGIITVTEVCPAGIVTTSVVTV